MGQGSSLTLSLGAVSYGLAAAGFLILTALLLTSWEGRAQGMRLIIACSVTSGWAALVALGAGQSPVGSLLALLAEFFRYGAWLFVLTGLTRAASIAPLLSRFAHFAWIGAVVLLLALPLLAGAGLPAPSPAALLATAGLLLALVGLLLLEQIFRNAREGGRYAFKFLVIGLGLTFAYDLFLFSQAHLLRGIEPATWQARGLVTALTVPLFAIAARRNPQWSLNLFVSRHVVFYSASAPVCGRLFAVNGGRRVLGSTPRRCLGTCRAARVRCRSRSGAVCGHGVGHPAPSTAGIPEPAFLSQQV